MRSLETVYELFGNTTGTHPVSPAWRWYVASLGICFAIGIAIVLILVVIHNSHVNHLKQRAKAEGKEWSQEKPDYLALGIWGMFMVLYVFVLHFYGVI